MQVMGVTGKLYNMKPGTTQNGKDKVSFRVSVRKQFVSDQDKQNNTTNVFIPMIANGPTATFIINNFQDGDMIAIGDMEYQTYRSQNADPNNNFDDAHIFKANRVGFCGGNGGNGNGNGNAGNVNSANNNRNQRPANNNNRQNNGGNYNNQRGGGTATATRPAQNQTQDNYNYQADDDLPF